ncbi:hypothetical protein E3P99_00579 [Wallemia hederae]|uniref:Uncharacterized protein n=1 Tax=Wallemia hederae TaxID=1540922 RepID=A0A4T0FW05_9BASI|nr:hypothetical protein E3P99_00579 [Wallemia hederae]
MVKPVEEVVQEFNKIVNMTKEELEEFLSTEESQNAGWGEGEESVGHNSGRHIIDILSKNPEKKPESYDEPMVEHMRKVVAYCNRHIKGELPSLESKSVDDIKQTKSYLSLKNWGHDVLKYLGKDSGDKKEEQGADADAEKKEGENGAEEEKKDEEKKEEGEEKKEEENKEEKEGEKKEDEKKEEEEKKDDDKEEKNDNKEEETKEEQAPAQEASEQPQDDAPDAAQAGDDEPAAEEVEDAQENGDKRKTDGAEQEAPQKAQKTEKAESAPTRRSTRGAKPVKSYNEDDEDDE